MQHRIAHPNSQPRTVVVTGLGLGGRRLVSALDSSGMPHVRVVDASRRGDAEHGALVDRIAESVDDFAREFDGADLILVVCEGGDDVGYAAPIARIAHHRGLLLTGVVVGAAEDPGNEGGEQLRALRRACDLIVIASDHESVEGMLAALGP